MLPFFRRTLSQRFREKSEYIFLDDSDESLKANMEVVEAIIGVRSAATAISRANVFRKLLSWVIANFPDSTQILDESIKSGSTSTT